MWGSNEREEATGRHPPHFGELRQHTYLAHQISEESTPIASSACLVVAPAPHAEFPTLQSAASVCCPGLLSATPARRGAPVRRRGKGLGGGKGAGGSDWTHGSNHGTTSERRGAE